MKNYATFKQNALKDKRLRAEYDKLGEEYEFIASLIRARIDRSLSQQELAEKMGTKQSAISRLESGQSNPSLAFIRKMADALDLKMKIRFENRYQ